MRKAFSKLTALLAIAAIGATFVACSDDDNYSISQAEIDLDRNAVGQLSPSSSVTQFNLKTDADAEWTAAVEWDEEENNQPAYVWPKKGTGSAVLKIATLENLTQQVRKANLVIRFPKDESKNITVPITQNRNEATNDDDAKERIAGNMARGFGYGYNPWEGYCDAQCLKMPILMVDQMYDEDALNFDWSDYKEDTREESGASVDEQARKLNTTAHAGVSKGGFSSTVDATFNGGQKSTASNEFAWLEMLVRTARPSLSVPFESAILRYMTDEAYDHINGIKRLEGRRERVLYPSTNEGFLKLVRDYGPYMVRGGQLGGRLRTSVVANTSKITSAYSASVALEASYSGSFFVDVDANATAKAQQASAQSRNHNGFYFQASVRGGSHSDGSFEALQSVLDKMSKARSGAGTEDDLIDDSETKVTIEDNSAEYEAAGAEWKRSLTTRFGLSESDVVNNIALIDFDSEADLVPLYELVDRYLTEDEDGVDGEERYQAFKEWFEDVLLENPAILTEQKDLNSYITNVPTKIEPLAQMTDAKDDESLVRDVYLSDGKHVARICSEYIPIINPSKRVSIIYPMVNGKCRYNLGIFCGDEASYPAKVSWGWDEDPSTPVVTSMPEYGKGLHNVAYLRGNHLTLEADPKFKDSDYETTTSQPYVLIADGYTYNLVKINDYMWCRDLYSGTHYQDGTEYENDLWKNVGGTWHGITGPEYYRVLDYSFHRLMHGGFGVTGWMVPWQDVVQKMVDNLNSVEGTKPDGALDASFRRGGVYGLNSAKPYNSSDKSTWAGFYVVYDGYKNGILVNPEVVYIPVLDSYDREKDNSGKALAEDTDIWTGQTGEVDTKTEDTCTAFAFVNGNASFVHFWDQAPTANTFDAAQWNKYRNRNTPIDYLKKDLSGDRLGNHVFYPVFLTQQIIK